MREDIFRSKSGKWPMPNFQMVSPKLTASLYSSVCIRFQGDSSHKIKVSLPSVFLREANSFAEIVNFRWQRRKWNGPDHRNREAFWETYSSAKKHFHQLEKKLDLEEANLHFLRGKYRCCQLEIYINYVSSKCETKSGSELGEQTPLGKRGNNITRKLNKMLVTARTFHDRTMKRRGK